MSTFREEQYYQKSFYYKDLTLTEVKYYSLKNYSKERCFQLSEITIDALQQLRKAKLSGFVLKIDEKLFFTEIPRNLKMISVPIEGLPQRDHLCCTTKTLCKYLSPNRCPKVKYGKCIEAFPYITSGYETFGTIADAFVVLDCKCFKV